MIVFLVLAALFESFLHPFVIITTVPLAIIGALVGLWMYGMSINVFSQIAAIMLVGLAAKNGILIVEFANQLRDRGRRIPRGRHRGGRDPPAPGADDELLHGVRRVAADAGLGRRRRVAASHRRRRVLRRGDLGGADAGVVPAVYALVARNTGSPQAVAQRLERLRAEARSRARTRHDARV